MTINLICKKILHKLGYTNGAPYQALQHKALLCFDKFETRYIGVGSTTLASLLSSLLDSAFGQLKYSN